MSTVNVTLAPVNSHVIRAFPRPMTHRVSKGYFIVKKNHHGRDGVIKDWRVKEGGEGEERVALSLSLSGLLASTYILYLKSIYTREKTSQIHALNLKDACDDFCAELHGAGDALAARIRALGHFAPGTVHDFVLSPAVKDEHGDPLSVVQMVDNLMVAHENCFKQAQKILLAAYKTGDKQTAELMMWRMTTHNRAVGLLRNFFSLERFPINLAR